MYQCTQFSALKVEKKHWQEARLSKRNPFTYCSLHVLVKPWQEESCCSTIGANWAHNSIIKCVTAVFSVWGRDLIETPDSASSATTDGALSSRRECVQHHTTIWMLVRSFFICKLGVLRDTRRLFKRVGHVAPSRRTSLTVPFRLREQTLRFKIALF